MEARVSPESAKINPGAFRGTNAATHVQNMPHDDPARAFTINTRLLPLENSLLFKLCVLQVATTEGFEWQSSAEDALGQTLKFSFASYAKVSAIKLKFPVGASYKFDLRVSFATNEEAQRTYLLKVGVLLCR